MQSGVLCRVVMWDNLMKSKIMLFFFPNLQVQHFPLHLQGEMERHPEIQAEEHVAGHGSWFYNPKDFVSLKSMAFENL